MEIIVTIGALAALLIFLAVRYLHSARKADGTKLVTERAEVRRKKEFARTEADLRAYIDFVVSFRTEDGETFECSVDRFVYRNLSEGDSGILKHRGSKFHSFSLDSGKILQD